MKASCRAQFHFAGTHCRQPKICRHHFVSAGILFPLSANFNPQSPAQKQPPCFPSLAALPLSSPVRSTTPAPSLFCFAGTTSAATPCCQAAALLPHCCPYSTCKSANKNHHAVPMPSPLIAQLLPASIPAPPLLDDAVDPITSPASLCPDPAMTTRPHVDSISPPGSCC